MNLTAGAVIVIATIVIVGILIFCTKSGKRVQVRSGSTKAFASCDETKGDKFDYKFGKNLALNRLIIKRIAEGLESSVK